ncbi:MAG: RNA polymerase sigma-70 factor [Bacteroidia bacterium]|nr:RNA polymerase sigma-70 factor [Bacteroidia bacterium]
MKSDKGHNELIAFNKLFSDYQGRFIRFASTYIDDEMAAEDIVMEAMMYCWENRMRLDFEGSLPSYLFTAIKNKCLNYIRDTNYRQAASEELQEHLEWKRSLQIATLEACNPEELLTKEMHEIVNRALAKLPEMTRRIFMMRRFEEKSYREIAAELDISVKGVEYHMGKATTLLKKSLKDFLPALLFLLYY